MGELKCEPQEDEPFSFEGPEIVKCTGCTIDWKKGKNLTVKQVKKKQKHKSKGSIRTITKQVKADSFFNFFDPPIVPDDPNADDDDEDGSGSENDADFDPKKAQANPECKQQ